MQLTLPAKITGIVFWGMVLVGLLASVYLLQSREDSLMMQYKASVLLISKDVESILENNSSHLKIYETLGEAFRKIEKNDYIEAIEFDYAGQHYAFGRRTEDQDKSVHLIRVHAIDADSSYVTTKLSIYLPSFQKSQEIADKA